MKYLALLLLLMPLGCDTTGAALAPQETPSTSRVSALSITYSRIDQRLMPVNIPTEVFDLVFSRLFGESTCRSGGGRLELLGLEVKALHRTQISLKLHSRECAAESFDLLKFSETNGRWKMTTAKSQVITP